MDYKCYGCGATMNVPPGANAIEHLQAFTAAHATHNNTHPIPIPQADGAPWH